MPTNLTLSEAVKIIPVSESTLRRDLKSGKLSFETDAKNRKHIDVSELTRVYGHLRIPETPTARESAEPVNETCQKLSLKVPRTGGETQTLPFLIEKVHTLPSPKVIALLQEQVQDLKARLAHADAEKSELLTLANNLQKQNAVLMLPPPEKEKRRWAERLKKAFSTTGT